MSYYWTDTNVLEKYPTIWKGILKNENNIKLINQLINSLIHH